MLEYLDTIESDSDFILESDTDDTSEEENYGPQATPPAAHPVSDSKEDDMDDEDYREINSFTYQPLPFQFQELSGPMHTPTPDSPPSAYFHLFFTDLILTLMVTESNRYAQQIQITCAIFRWSIKGCVSLTFFSIKVKKKLRWCHHISKLS
jgi:hypothetical protein